MFYTNIKHEMGNASKSSPSYIRSTYKAHYLNLFTSNLCDKRLIYFSNTLQNLSTMRYITHI